MSQWSYPRSTLPLLTRTYWAFSFPIEAATPVLEKNNAVRGITLVVFRCNNMDNIVVAITGFSVNGKQEKIGRFKVSSTFLKKIPQNFCYLSLTLSTF